MQDICLGYYNEQQWDTMSERERNALIDACFAYDDVLRKHGHVVGGEALQRARNATTLRWQNGTVFITDGPYAETKAQVGGILVLDARDLNHAIQLLSKHPGVQVGPFEIRPAADLTDMIRDREQRRSSQQTNEHERHHFMVAPGGEDWPSAGCPGCSMFVDQLGHPAHPHARDVSRAPLANIESYRKRMGWTWPWFSSAEHDFSIDFGPTTANGDMFGLSVFLRDGDDV